MMLSCVVVFAIGINWFTLRTATVTLTVFAPSIFDLFTSNAIVVLSATKAKIATGSPIR